MGVVASTGKTNAAAREDAVSEVMARVTAPMSAPLLRVIDTWCLLTVIVEGEKNMASGPYLEPRSHRLQPQQMLQLFGVIDYAFLTRP
jgi:hypothetical protein